MSCVTAQKREEKTGRKGPGPLLSLLMLFGNPDAAAGPSRMVRRADGACCPGCGERNVTRYCRYGAFRRYSCRDCMKTFNDKTGTILHYRQVNVGGWMLAVWMYLAGPPNGMSVNYIAGATGRTYRATYRMVRDMTERLRDLPEGRLSGTGEADGGYFNAASKGVPPGANGEDRTAPGRRGLPRGPGRGTFEKNSPMITVYRQRAAGDGPDITIFDVPRDHSKTLADMAGGRFEPGPAVMTDGHPAYKSLKGRGYDHHTVNHSEGEYAAGKGNEIHTNNCECRVGLLRWWFKKHRGVSKWHLVRYAKSSRFVHNHRHHAIEGRFVVTLAALLDQYSGRQA